MHKKPCLYLTHIQNVNQYYCNEHIKQNISLATETNTKRRRRHKSTERRRGQHTEAEGLERLVRQQRAGIQHPGHLRSGALQRPQLPAVLRGGIVRKRLPRGVEVARRQDRGSEKAQSN